MRITRMAPTPASSRVHAFADGAVDWAGAGDEVDVPLWQPQATNAASREAEAAAGDRVMAAACRLLAAGPRAGGARAAALPPRQGERGEPAGAPRPDGYNRGVKEGAGAGESFPHPHCPLPPRSRAAPPAPGGATPHVPPTRR